MIKKEFIIYNQTYRCSLLCFFNISKKDAIRRLNKYNDNKEFIGSLEIIKGIGEKFCYDGNKKFMLYMDDFNEKNLEDLSCLVHEIRHLTDFLVKRINFEDKIEYVDLEWTAYYSEWLFKSILEKLIYEN